MSLKRNILANYASQAYVTIVGIAMVPVYLRTMGAEGYGLVGFFVMLQAWLQLLDAGLTATMTREAARYGGGVVDAWTLRRLLRLLEVVFVVLAVAAAVTLSFGAQFVAVRWLDVQTLPDTEVATAIRLMAATLVLRWVCGLYRGVLIGFEHLVPLSAFNAAAASVRFIGVAPYLILVGHSPADFFAYQLTVAVLELVLLTAWTYRVLPSPGSSHRPPWLWASLRNPLKFSLEIAFASSVWVLVTQTDKLLLSKLLPLDEYGYFSLAVMAAGGITMLSAPVGAALMARLARAAAEKDDAGLLGAYRSATQLVAAVVVPITLALALFAEEVLWAWTGDRQAAAAASSVLSLYVLGNGVLALSAFAYYLQYAKGDLRLHMLGHLLFLVLLVPALIWTTSTWGGTGAGYAWLFANSAYFLLWVPLVHRRFFDGLHTNWLVRDLAPIFVPAAGFGVALRLLFGVSTHDRSVAAMEIALVALTLAVLAVLGSSSLRHALSQRLHTTLVKRSLP